MLETAYPSLRSPAPARPRRRWLWVAFALLMLPFFLCGGALLTYALFPPPPLDIMILGLDAREGEGTATRTDSIILVGVNPSRLRVGLLSIPRDLFIDVPGYGLQRINTVNVLGEREASGNGPLLLKSAIRENFGVQIEDYVRLDFEGFIELIDAVGGVTINVERAIEDYAYPTPDGGTIQVRFEPGVQRMDGERALMYARTRHSDDDYARADRQQQVITALARELLNPTNWPAAMRTYNQAVESTLTPGDLLAAVPSLLFSGGNFDRLVIDRDYITSAEGVAVPDYAALDDWLRTYFN